jgi:competence protein ComFC
MFVVERLISVVAPHECLVCGSEGDLVCGWCLPDVFEPVPSRCYRCYKQTTDSQVCITCKRSSKLKHVWVATEYSGHAKELVRVFKFERAQAADSILAKSIYKTIPYLPGYIIVPVPTASSRRRIRGYDQTKLVSKHLSGLAGLPKIHALARQGQMRQVGSKRKQRQAQMKGAFKVIKKELVNKKHVLLVDDIVTTGATLEEAARTLKEAGAKSVSAAVFAQSR